MKEEKEEIGDDNGMMDNDDEKMTMMHPNQTKTKKIPIQQ